MRKTINYFLDLDNIDPQGVEYMMKWGVTAFLSLFFAALPVLLAWFGTHQI